VGPRVSNDVIVIKIGRVSWADHRRSLSAYG
jgi:hypothetical protein